MGEQSKLAAHGGHGVGRGLTGLNFAFARRRDMVWRALAAAATLSERSGARTRDACVGIRGRLFGATSNVPWLPTLAARSRSLL